MNSVSFREKIECSLLDLVEVSVDVLSLISQLTEHMLTVTHVSFFHILPVLSQNFGQILKKMKRLKVISLERNVQCCIRSIHKSNE